jgi:hypothetical protein
LKSLEFHHINGGKDKKFIISNAWKKDKKIVIEELNKCVLLCKNCHGEEQDGMITKEKILQKIGALDRYCPDFS